MPHSQYAARFYRTSAVEYLLDQTMLPQWLQRTPNLMLLVNARCGPSTIHGLGLISHEFIPAGRPVWVVRRGFDVILTEADFLELSLPARQQVCNYAYFCLVQRVFVLSSDDDRFTNHSEQPNIQFEAETAVAIRDILAGEEITGDYRELGWTQLLGVPSTSAHHGPDCMGVVS